LDALVKNCGEDLHRALNRYEVMHELKMIVYHRWQRRHSGRSRESHYKNLCGEKAARMVQHWGIAFHGKRRELPWFCEVYRRCVQKGTFPAMAILFFWFTLCFINSISVSIGVVFPPPTDDDRAPIDTPQKRLASAKEKLKKSQAAPPSSAVNAALTEAHDSVKLLKDMLENPGMTNDIVVDIVKDLHRQQKRIQDLVNDNIDKEKILQLLLGASDHIQTARTVFHLYSYPFSLHVLCRS
jgi:hypothetical protein